MPTDTAHVKEIVERVFAGHEGLEACRRRDLGAIVRLCRKYGITQGAIAGMTGIGQGRLSEYNRGKRGQPTLDTLEALADGLGMPPPARRALGLTPTSGPGTPAADEHGFPIDTFDLQQLAEEIGRRDPVKRRDMLALAASIGAGAAIAQSDVWERLTYALTNPSATNETIVREMEARSVGFYRLEEIVSAQSVLKGLTVHLREVSTLLNGRASDPEDDLRRRIVVVAGESSLLAGWSASALGDTGSARHFYDTAIKAADEAGDPPVTACALAYRSYIPSVKGANGRARVLLTEALENVTDRASPATVAWIAARHAEESAQLGDTAQALESWRRAENAYGIADPDEDRVWARFLNQDRFDTFCIATYLRVGKLDEAEEIAANLLARLTPVLQSRFVT